MIHFLHQSRRFAKDETGAVTVDWTVLAAAVVGLGMASVTAVRTGTTDLGSDIETGLSAASVASLGELGGLPFSYSLLSYGQSYYDHVMNNVMPGVGDQSLIDSYVFLANWVLSELDAGRTPSGANVDWLYFRLTEMENRGLSLPDGAPSLRDVNDRYLAATG